MSEPSQLAIPNQVCSFLRRARSSTRRSEYDTLLRVFLNVSETAYTEVIKALGVSFHARIDYLGDLPLLVITLPGLPHEILTSYSSFIYQSLHSQGFWWPSWGGNPHAVFQCGASDVEYRYHDKLIKLQPDGGLQLSASKFPFLVIEIADTESYEHVRMKARRLLLHTMGKVRFVVIIDLVRKTRKQMKEEGVKANKEVHSDHEAYKDSSSGESYLGNTSLDELGSEPAPVGAPESVNLAISRKRTANNEDEDTAIPKKARVHSDNTSASNEEMPLGSSIEGPLPPSAGNASLNPSAEGTLLPASTGDASPSSNKANTPLPTSPGDAPPSPSTDEPSLPQNPRAIYARGLVTVLTTIFTPHHTHADKKTCKIINLVTDTEFWPCRPENSFTFSWEDMNLEYPPCLEGKVFTVEFSMPWEAMQRFHDAGTEGEPKSKVNEEDLLISSSSSDEISAELTWALQGKISSEIGESEDSEWKEGDSGLGA